MIEEKKNPDVIPSPSPMSGAVPEGKQDREKKKSFGLAGLSSKSGKFKNLPFKKKIPFVLMILVFVVVGLFVVLYLIQSAMPEKPKPLPSIAPTESVTETVTPPSSKYATDSAVLKIQKDLEELDQALEEAKFREEALLPPEIDLNVKFDVTD